MKEKTFSEIAGKSTINLISELIKDNAQDIYYLLAAAPTGKGKSYFVKNDLYNFCKKHHYKILYLLPRRVVVDEFKAELAEDKKDDIIEVRTYHSLENNETHDYSNYFNKYKVVICDECHYFVSDSTFNPYVERSFVRIIKYAPHAIKFYITATETPIQDILTHILDKLNRKLLFLKLENETPIEEQPMNIKFLKADYEDQKEKNIQKILDKIGDTENEEEKDILNNIPNGEKAIVFCDTAKYAHDLWKKHKNESLFICSRGNEKNKYYLKDIDEAAYNKMLHEHKFDCKYVFCTSALDVGFSIKDKQLKHIICLLWDWNSIVQAIGRKRILDDVEDEERDTFTVYLRDYSNRSIGGLMTENKKKFEHYNYLKEHGAQAYYDEYEKINDPAKIIYYGRNKNKEFEPAVSRLVLMYYANNERILEEINGIKSKWKYQNWVRQQLKLPPKKDRTAYGIERDLKPLVDEKKIFVGNEGKKELAKIIGLCDDRGRVLTTPEKINPELEKLEVHYRIVKGSRDKETKKQTYYITGQDE